MKTTKEETKKVIRELFDDYLKKNGLRMSKKISAGGGFLFYSSPVFDYRTVYNRQDLEKLNVEGFLADESLGLFIFNMINTQV